MAQLELGDSPKSGIQDKIDLFQLENVKYKLDFACTEGHVTRNQPISLEYLPLTYNNF